MSPQFHPAVWWLWSLVLAIDLARANSSLSTFISLGFMTVLVLTAAPQSPWSGSFWVALKLGAWIIWYEFSSPLLWVFLILVEPFSHFPNYLFLVGWQVFT